MYIWHTTLSVDHCIPPGCLVLFLLMHCEALCHNACLHLSLYVPSVSPIILMCGYVWVQFKFVACLHVSIIYSIHFGSLDDSCYHSMFFSLSFPISAVWCSATSAHCCIIHFHSNKLDHAPHTKWRDYLVQCVSDSPRVKSHRAVNSDRHFSSGGTHTVH